MSRSWPLTFTPDSPVVTFSSSTDPSGSSSLSTTRTRTADPSSGSSV